MDKDTALKLALEALGAYMEATDSDEDAKAHSLMAQAFFAIKEALAQPAPVQEPVAWMEMVVANLVREGINKHKARELAQHFYTPPQRTWVGLDDTDIGNEYVRFEIIKGGFNRFEYAVRAIEAKLKEKNFD